jgi:hypothetical protein
MTTYIIIRCLYHLLTNIVFIKDIYTFCYYFNINIGHFCYFYITSFNIIFGTSIVYTCAYNSCYFRISIYSFIFLNPFIIFKCVVNNWFWYFSNFTNWSNFIINVIKFFVLIWSNVFLLILDNQLSIFFPINIWTPWLIKHFLFLIGIICSILFPFIIIIITFILIVYILITYRITVLTVIHIIFKNNICIITIFTSIF